MAFGSKVALMRADEYAVDLIQRKITEAFGLLGIVPPRSSRVLLKPNIMSQNTPTQCTTTHPAVIEALCRLFIDSGNRVTIGESSAFYQGGYTDRGFRTTGIEAVVRKYGCRLVSFERGPVRLARVQDPAALGEFLVSSEIDEADYLVSVPKLKTHNYFRLSGAVKNLFGLIPGPAKFEYHYLGGEGREAFARKLADIWRTARPSLCVMDAVRCLEGFGPAATGSPKQVGLVLVSENGWAADYAASKIAGFDPEDLEQTRVGRELGLLPKSDDISIAGDFPTLPVIPFKQAKSGSETPKDKNPLYGLSAVHPAVRARRCDLCMACVSACPLHAIAADAAGRAVTIDAQRCLRCLHCVYVCPRGALAVRGDSPFHLPARAVRRVLGL